MAMEEPWILRAYYKLCMDFQLCGGSVPLTPALFKGQLYLQKSLHSSTEISVCLNNWEKVCVWYKMTATLPSFPIAKSSQVDTSKLHDNTLSVIG